MLRSIPQTLFYEWLAYWQIEPFGQDWHRTAKICAAAANAPRYARTGGKPWTEDDFMPTQGSERKQTPEQMAAVFRAMAREHNAKKATKSKP